MKGIYFVIVFILGFLGANTAFAEETVSLSALIEEAQKNNPELEALRLHQEGAKEDITQATFLDDPQLTLTQWGIPQNFNISRADQTWLGIEQTFPYPGKRQLKQKIATIDWEIAQQAYQARLLEVSAEIKLAYYNLSLIDKTIDLHQEHQSLINELVRVAEKRYIVGQSTQQDLLKAELELAKLHNSRETLEQDRIVTKAKINALLNRPDSDSVGRPEPVVYRPFTFLYDALLQEALNNQNALKSARFRVEKSASMSALTAKATLPDFMIGLSYWDVHRGTSPANGENQWMLMGKINLPWFFGGKYDSKNRQAALEADEATASYNAVKNETRSAIKTIFTKIKTDEQRIDRVQNNLIPLATQSLKSAQIGYQSGKTDFLNFIDSERTLLDLQMEYTLKLTDYYQQVAQLSPLIGKEINP